MSAELSSPISDASSGGSIEVNDAIFCQHGKEVCTDCDFDGREENDVFFGFDHKDRDPLDLPDSTVDKEGKRKCKKHANGNCAQCFGWKKQIMKLQKDAKKRR
ncbi:hypothetical protein FRC03_005969 [Tulasnella sp. 419]|nr:hypothetical protein FRC02_011582 [Tulasnella sp. 418]KAG8968789.1 hypothetical protein FRC03_005969 [Tulasnella sp. 419]